ncbi:hypothetical protein ACLOJK_010612 [Asimina triloba]
MLPVWASLLAKRVCFQIGQEKGSSDKLGDQNPADQGKEMEKKGTEGEGDSTCDDDEQTTSAEEQIERVADVCCDGVDGTRSPLCKEKIESGEQKERAGDELTTSSGLIGLSFLRMPWVFSCSSACRRIESGGACDANIPMYGLLVESNDPRTPRNIRRLKRSGSRYI